MSTLNFNGLKSYNGMVSEREFNRLVDIVQSITLNPGPNYLIRRNAAGTVIAPRGTVGGSTCPFTVSFAPITGDPDNIKVRISPGTVNQLVPTNQFSSFTIAKTGTYYVKVTAVSDGAKVTSSSFAVDGSEPSAQTPVPSALPSSVDILLAIVKDSVAYRTISCGSVQLNGHEEFRVDKVTAEPGQLAYTAYFTWMLS